MIPAKDTTVEIVGNVTGTKINMGIDPGSWEHLMGLLSGIYEDTVRAVIREYAVNAVDAHVEAGQTRPIEVFLPNELETNFRVKDYGVGLDEETVRTIYSQYGASTKRQTNDQTGAFGIGCKSAFAYTNQFTVTANKDGIQTQVLVQRDGEGAGSMTVVAKFPTEEPNGVEVSIPVERTDTRNFERKAKDVFRFFKPGTVLVDGVAPEHIDGLRFGDDILLWDRENQEHYSDYIVMGNVAYPVDPDKARHDYLDEKGETVSWEWDTKTKVGQSLVVFVPLGSVTPAPTREGLSYKSDNTQEALRKALDTYRERVKGQVQRMIDQANTKPEALRAAIHWHNRLPSIARGNEYTFKGLKLPTEFAVGDVTTISSAKVIVVPGSKPESDPYFRRMYGEKVSKHSREFAIPIEIWPDAMWVTGHAGREFTAPMRKKLDKYVEDNGMDQPSYFFLTPKGLPHDVRQWITGRIVTYETIKAVKLPRNSSGGRSSNPARIPGSYDMWIVENGDANWRAGIPADNIDTTNPVFWVDLKDRHTTNYVNVIKHRHQDFTVVELSTNRVEKFERNFPMARQAQAGVREAFNAWFARITKADALAMHIHDQHIGHHVRDMLTRIKPAKVDDPAIKRAAKMIQRTDVTNLLSQRRTFERLLGQLPQKKKVEEWKNPLEGYPLVDGFRPYHMTRGTMEDHMYLYLNAAYAAKTNGGAK